MDIPIKKCVKTFYIVTEKKENEYCFYFSLYMTNQDETHKLANKIASIFINAENDAENNAEELKNRIETLKRALKFV
jgi:hypothetical protein